MCGKISLLCVLEISLFVVCVKEKARALKLRWIPLLGDTTYTAKWSYFGRYWIGLRDWVNSFPTGPFSEIIHDRSISAMTGPRYIKHASQRPIVRSEMPKMQNLRVKTFYLLLIRPSDQRSCESQCKHDLSRFSGVLRHATRVAMDVAIYQ